MFYNNRKHAEDLNERVIASDEVENQTIRA